MKKNNKLYWYRNICFAATFFFEAVAILGKIDASVSSLVAVGLLTAGASQYAYKRAFTQDDRIIKGCLIIIQGILATSLCVCITFTLLALNENIWRISTFNSVLGPIVAGISAIIAITTLYRMYRNGFSFFKR